MGNYGCLASGIIGLFCEIIISLACVWLINGSFFFLIRIISYWLLWLVLVCLGAKKLCNVWACTEISHRSMALSRCMFM